MQQEPTLFPDIPEATITWKAVHKLYGQQAVVTGVKEWFHPENGWKEYPATSAMATDPADQVRALILAGGIAFTLYIDVGPEDTRTSDFHKHELLDFSPCST